MSNWKNKMSKYEVTPPAGSWEKIAAAIDESNLNDRFPSRLYNTEVTPPASAWDKISASLEASRESPSVAPVRRLSPWLRYAAAAILIGLVAFGIIKFTTSDDAINTLPLANGSKDSSKPLNNSMNIAGSITDSAIDPATSNKSQTLPEIEKSSLAKSAAGVKNSRSGQPITSRRIIDENDLPEEDLTQTLYAYADHIPTIADRYVMLMTPDGNIIRMSKKWGELLCCVSGEEQDADCKDQIKKWQQKIAASEIAPSPGNFMDILGLVNSLNENDGL